MLRRVLDYAVLYEDIKTNPALRIPLPKKKKDGSEEREVFLTAEEAQKMLDTFQEEEIGPLVFTTLYYGLRKSEALGLRWSAVDFQKNTISINHVVVKNKTIIEKDTTKSYSSRRTYELLPEVREILLHLKQQQEENRAVFGSAYQENDYIFKWADGTMYRPDGITRTFQRALERHGLKKMRFHDLRHSTASILVDKGWDINDIKEWLGHADIETTANIYAHISHSRKISLAKDMENVLTFRR